LKSFENKKYGEAADVQACSSRVKTYVEGNWSVVEGFNQLFSIGSLRNQTAPLKIFQ
jgi:hypothetical protein